MQCLHPSQVDVDGAVQVGDTVHSTLNTVHCTLYSFGEYSKLYSIPEFPGNVKLPAGHTVQPQHYRQLKIHS